MSGYHCRHCGSLCGEFRDCQCPEAKGEAAAQRAILSSVMIRYTVRLHREDDSAWDVFPAWSGEFQVAWIKVRDALRNTQVEAFPRYDKAEIVGGLETWEITLKNPSAGDRGTIDQGR